MSYDLCKTQFLFPKGFDAIKTFRRKRRSVLFGNDGKPIRPMTYQEWTDLTRMWPEETKRDGLKLRYVWTLEEVA